ncbi:MAG TPA: 8-amino-7-oxononanoate synthase [Pirellulales bacterium]|jgi:8-amino-7-oxononanoate synthase
MSGDPLAWLDEELGVLDAQHLRRRLMTRAGPQEATFALDGKNLINFGANDYLGLAADSRLAKAAAEAAKKEGWGAGASPLITGRSAAHAELEQILAEFEGTEAALAFTSGFAANCGTVAALTGAGDAIFADAKNHASLIDGCRLSRAEIHIYRHGDVNHLVEQLRDASRYRRRLIVTDSLFSMDGDLAPLPQLAEAAQRHQCMLMVDEAHATGVFGRQGRGVAEHLGVKDGVHIRMGTLSKALGSAGGFVAGERRLIDWLVNRARSYVFSTAFPPAVAAAASAALQIVRDEPQRRTELLERAAALRQKISAQGWNLGRSASQIIPIYVGEPDRAMQLAQMLRDRGLLVPGIRPPSVPAGESLLRISLSWAHTPAMLDELLASLADCWAAGRPV